MGNLLASLVSAASSMRTLERSLAAVHNNVTNASTPGYARQTQLLKAERFNPAAGLPGGVSAGELISARSSYSEQAVQRQASSFGRSDQTRTSLTQLESVFDISENSGIAASLNRLYQGFSLLSVSPNDASARQVVLDRASEAARSFNLAASDLGQAAATHDAEARNVVDTINRLAGQIRDINLERRQDFRTKQDAGMDAKLNAALEQLAALTDFTALPQDDGSVSIFVGGQVPIVIGDRLLPLSAETTGTSVIIRNQAGTDITAILEKGRLGAILDVRNSQIPSFSADLNRMAQAFADRVNTVLNAGLDINGQPPSINLFTYNATSGVAATLAVSSITPQELAAADVSAPGGNANALILAGLSSSREIDGYTFTQFYGNLAARLGRRLASATDDAEAQNQLLLQARSMREQVSGVSLDVEAAQLLELQRGYQAVGKLFNVLNDLTAEVLGLMR